MLVKRRPLPVQVENLYIELWTICTVLLVPIIKRSLLLLSLLLLSFFSDWQKKIEQ